MCLRVLRPKRQVILNLLSRGLYDKLLPPAFTHQTLPISPADEGTGLRVKDGIQVDRVARFFFTRGLRLEVVELAFFLETLHYLLEDASL